MRSLFAVLLLVAACRTQPLDFDGGVPGSDLATEGPIDGGRRDMSRRDLAGPPTSCCGVDGNPGNENGVGRFCTDSIDCQSVTAKTCASTFAIAVSGVAGPDGGTAEKPVGTVFIAVTSDGVRDVRKLFWPAEREQVRQLAASAALHLLFKTLGR